MSQDPGQLLIFGTNATEGGQTFKIHGNGYLAAGIYAPNANVELKGGGNAGRVYGAVVAYDAKLTGNSHFSFDEALGVYNLGGGDYSVTQWVELTDTTSETAKFAMATFFRSLLLAKRVARMSAGVAFRLRGAIVCKM